LKIDELEIILPFTHWDVAGVDVSALEGSKKEFAWSSVVAKEISKQR
jgi:hypothetical protein